MREQYLRNLPITLRTSAPLRLCVMAFLLFHGIPVHSDNLTVWPNSVSKANSDEWLVRNHDRIRQMQPRLLVLNFANGVGAEKAKTKVDSLIAALKESSRYHGFENPQAPAFLDYQVEKLVDLTDSSTPAD